MAALRSLEQNRWRTDQERGFADQLRGFVRHLVVLQGGMTAKERSRSAGQLASIPDTAERLVLTTGRYIGEGFDDAGLDTFRGVGHSILQLY